MILIKISLLHLFMMIFMDTEVNVKSVIELKNQLNNRKIKNSDSNSMVHISKLDLKSFRKCTECGRVLPVIKFSKNNSSADGVC